MKEDTMFLQLYPYFIDEVNAQLTEPLEAKRGTLPSELRIFALMRLGITNNEQMAHILSCSLSTIHTYKAHVYSRLKCSKDSFLHETCG
jgi:DNA-binding NarL/FixJ family response regulator